MGAEEDEALGGTDEDDPATATVYRGDAEWHDGPGFYWIDDQYPDEGSCGAFATVEAAVANAQACDYVVTISVGAA